MMSSAERIDTILAYCNEHGESATLEKFSINIETLHRYERDKRWRETKQPKILLLDVETSFMEVRVWGLYKQRIPHTNIINDWHFHSWAAKWIFDSEIYSDVQSPREAVNRNDKRICESLWEMVNNADIIIGHNAARFDIRKMNTRFYMNNLKPPMPYQIIDTLRIAQKYFSFSSNRLDYLGKLIRNRGKIKTDYDLWVRCAEGDKEALTEMETYNKEDVAILEECYIELRPWIKSHPNLAVLMDADEPCCPNCGSLKFEEKEGYYTTPQNRYISVRCAECGAVNRMRESDMTADKRKKMLVPAAR